MLWLKVYCMVVFQTFSLKLYCFSDWAWAGPVHQRSSSRGSIIYITFRPCKTSSSTSGKSDNWPRRWSGISSVSSRRCSWGLSTIAMAERQDMGTVKKSAGRWVIVLTWHWSVRSITTGEQLITVKWSVMTTVLPRTLDWVSVWGTLIWRRGQGSAMGGVETSKSLIRVCLASEREGEPRANDQVIFIWMNIYSEIVIQVADSQQERRPSWRKCWRGEREGDETRIVSVISSRGGGARAASCRTPCTAPAGKRRGQLQLVRDGRCCVVIR